MKQLAVEFASNEMLQKAYMVFVANGGLFVETRDSFTMGDEVALQVTLPDSLEADLVEGKVVWFSPINNQQNAPMGIGVMFTNDDKKVKQQIERALSNLLSTQEPTYTM